MRPRPTCRSPTRRPSSSCPRPAARCASTSSTVRSSTAPARRSKHDAILATAASTTRGELGAVTTAGRVIRFSPVDLPSVPPASVQLGAGVVLRDYLGHHRQDRARPRARPLRRRHAARARHASGRREAHRALDAPAAARRSRSSASSPATRSWARRSAPDDAELVFVTSDAQLLRFAAAAVRPQGAPAGGMAGINLSAKASVVFFGAVEGDDVIAVTHLGRRGRAARHRSRAASRSRGSRSSRPRAARPAACARTRSCRARTGSRSRGSAGDARARGRAGRLRSRTLPEATAKRDASGQPLDAVIGSIGRHAGLIRCAAVRDQASIASRKAGPRTRR